MPIRTHTFQEEADDGKDLGGSTDTSAVDSALGIEDNDEGGEDKGSALAAMEESLGIADDTPAPTDDADDKGDATPAAAKDDQAPPAGDEPGDKPGDKPAAAEDPFADELEQGVSERTRERFETMVASHNDLKTQHEDLTGRHQGIVDVMNQTGASNEELALSFDYMRMRRSENPQDLQEALRMANAERDDIARRLGQELPGMDLLANHTDLSTRVESMELTREDALQIAQARDQQAAQLQSRTQQDQNDSAAQTYQTQVDAGVQALNALDTELQADIDYLAKRRMVDKYAENMFKTIPPDQWVAAYRGYWSLAGDMATVATPKPRREHQAVTNAGNGAGGRREVKSALEALENSIGIAPD